MIREKQIEEMAKSIASTPIGAVKPDLTLTEMGEVYNGAFISRIAKHLYEMGYAKASDVAREIIAEIENIIEVDEEGEAKFNVRELFKIEQKYTEGKK